MIKVAVETLGETLQAKPSDYIVHKIIAEPRTLVGLSGLPPSGYLLPGSSIAFSPLTPTR
jgi:hypothetical protein